MYGNFDNQTDYFNYHFKRIERERYLSNKYIISKIDKKFLEEELLKGFDSKNPLINRLYGETIIRWLENHLYRYIE